LVPGRNTLTAVATDTAGNSSAPFTVEVTRQEVAGQRLEIVSGNNQTGRIGEILAQPIVVRALDAGGNPLANRVLDLRVVRNDGLVRGVGQEGGSAALSLLTDEQGQVAVEWVLGTRAGVGNNRVEVSAAGFAVPVGFCASATAAACEKLLAIGGENQVGVAGAALARPLEVLAVDAGGNFCVGVPVTFSVAAGGGSFAGAPTVTLATNADGRAAAVLTLGPAPGVNANVVTATFPDLALAEPTFLESAVVSGPESQTRFVGTVLEGFALKVFAHSAHFPDGSTVGEMGVTQVTNDRVPMPPSGGNLPPWVGTFQPAGVELDPPAQLTAPNSLGLPPGAIVDMFSF